MQSGTTPSMGQWFAGLALAAVVASVAYRLRWLSADGAVAGAAVGGTVFGVGGWLAGVPLVAFFITANAAGMINPRLRDDSRNAKQVLANGGVAAVCCGWAYLSRNPHALGAYLGSLAAAAADTCATEFGTRFGRSPVRILSRRPALRGESGVITIAGLIGGLGGAFVIGLTALIWDGGSAIGPITLIGAAGSLADSIIGDVLQARYRCSACGKSTENSSHCGMPCHLVGGISFVTNNVTNLACTVSGSTMGLLVTLAAR